MTSGINAPMKNDSMGDLVKSLNAREKELNAYLRCLAEDREKCNQRSKEITLQMNQSERDLTRVQRAIAVLRDDEEPIRGEELAPTLLPGVRFTGRDTAYGSDIRIGENEG